MFLILVDNCYTLVEVDDLIRSLSKVLSDLVSEDISVNFRLFCRTSRTTIAINFNCTPHSKIETYLILKFRQNWFLKQNQLIKKCDATQRA